MIAILKWQASTQKDRMSVIEEVKETISNKNGAIVNFTMFSDLDLNLSIEIEGKDVMQLHQSLSQVLANISPLDANSPDFQHKKELLILLNISFMAGSGKIKIEAPAVPG